MAREKTFLTWLNDAYAMEQSLIEVLERRVKQLEGRDQLRNKVAEHLEQTQRHAAMVQSAIERLGGSVSPVKAGWAEFMGAMQGMMSGMTADNLAKAAISDYTAEHFEIASYRALQAAAEEMGDTETAQIAAAILKDEEGMASFLEQHMPSMIKEVLAEADKE